MPNSNTTSVMTVQTCTPTAPIPGNIPQAQDTVTPEMFNILSENIASGNIIDYYASIVRDQAPCIVCSDGGAVVFNCLDNCQNFKVFMTEDINSISVLGCNECPFVEFVIPANKTYRICGWPVGCSYSGGECTDAPVSGPMSVFSNGLSLPGAGSGGGSGSLACPCITTPLTTDPPVIQCCPPGATPEQCELSCSGTNVVTLKACGGLAPYSWEVTSNGKLNTTGGATVKVSLPPLDPNPALPAFAQIGVRVKSQAGGFGIGNCFTGPAGFVVRYLDCNGNLMCNTSYVQVPGTAIPPYNTFGAGCTNHCNGTSNFGCGAITINSYTLGSMETCGACPNAGDGHNSVTIHATDDFSGQHRTITTTPSGWCNSNTISDCYFCHAYPCTQCIGQTDDSCVGSTDFKQCQDFFSTDTLNIRPVTDLCTGCPVGDFVTVTVTDTNGSSVAVDLEIIA